MERARRDQGASECISHILAWSACGHPRVVNQVLKHLVFHQVCRSFVEVGAA